MKKNHFILLLIPTLISCNNGISSMEESSYEESISSEILSSDISISSISEDLQVIDGRTAQELIINAVEKDLLYAHTSTDLILSKGYDGGSRYSQTITSSYTGYLDNLTIGLGNIVHEVNDKIYQDTFDHVKSVKNYNYVDAKSYKNKLFNEEFESVNLMQTINPTEAYALSIRKVSPGAGYLAYEDLYYFGVTLACDLYYTAKYQDDNLLITFFAETKNVDSNQQFIGEYTYLFDSLESGFLLSYTAEQAFYSLDVYEKTEDKGLLEPVYYGKEVINVNKGSLTAFEGQLPIDIDSSFVKAINLSAKKTTIEVDETVALKAEVLPKTAADRSLIFASSNESVCRVDYYTGRVLGVDVGTCTISCLNVSSGVEAEIEITVIEKGSLSPNDDAIKGDLKEALDLAKNQYIPIEKIYHDTIVGMCIDEELTLNGEALSQLSISDFYYDEVTRTATYVGNKAVLEAVIPFYDNGNANLSNRYIKKNSRVYKDNILSMEIELSYLNEIEIVHFEMRTDSAELNGVDFASLTDENISQLTFSVGYPRHVYYENGGFYEEE